VPFDVAVIVSTFERPGHLKRCLASLAAQRGVEGRFEVVVTDDGSRDDTLQLLAEEVGRQPFACTLTTHLHEGFRLARCRNEGVAASTAPYVLFTDGDCILPPDHLAIHLQALRPGRVIVGDCVRLDEAATVRVDAESLRAGRFPQQLPAAELRRLQFKGLRAKVYELCRVSMRPRLSGNNIGVWRRDYERVNGFDEQYVGWGLEDRDLQYRLERIGVRASSVMLQTVPVHLWHPLAPTFARNGTGTANFAYFAARASRPTFCIDGLTKPTAGTAVVPFQSNKPPITYRKSA
jgi:glycosyltransferase involved in cell wall biosynthesis